MAAASAGCREAQAKPSGCSEVSEVTTRCRSRSARRSPAGALGCERTFRELKAELEVAVSRCVNKSELQAVLDRCQSLLQEPLSESLAPTARESLGTTEECAAAVPRAEPAEQPGGEHRPAHGNAAAAPHAEPAEQPGGEHRSAHGAAASGSRAEPAEQPGGVHRPAHGAARSSALAGAAATNSPMRPPPPSKSAEAQPVAQRIEAELQRIEALRKEAFGNIANWGFAVLGVTDRTMAAVQRGYRALMGTLHPDKVRGLEVAGRAACCVEVVCEAKKVCELQLSRLERPGPPRNLRYMVLSWVPGKRRIKLEWDSPLKRQEAPVDRYVVAAFDPAWGMWPSTIAVLEPEYNQALHRFVSVEEIGSFLLSEESFEKLPMLFKLPFVMVHVAAANKVGQSDWATLSVAISAAASFRPGPTFVPWPGAHTGPSAAAASSGGSCSTPATAAQKRYMAILAKLTGRQPTAADLASKVSASLWIDNAKRQGGA